MQSTEAGSRPGERGEAGPVVADPVPASVVTLLMQTRPWVRFLAILGHLILSLGFLRVVISLVQGGKLSIWPEVVGATVSLVILLLFLPAVVYLWRYADSIRRLETARARVALESVLANQKKFWRFLGFATVVMLLAFVALALVGFVVGFSGRR